MYEISYIRVYEEQDTDGQSGNSVQMVKRDAHLYGFSYRHDPECSQEDCGMKHDIRLNHLMFDETSYGLAHHLLIIRS